ncbi:MAG TPA: immunoglobulin domain-containing protein [Verrucomicrobiota bacterium]|nr:immunoglobulin domain-containing protein [Verrucomicrobiota bacterium]
MKKIVALTILLTLGSHASRATLLMDGDFESLSLGTAPSVNASAGNWHFPEDYVLAGVAETNLGQYTIEHDPTTPGAGRCLRLEADADLAGNQHLVNLFATPATSGSLLLQVDFDVYVSPDRGGGSVYLGNGGYWARGPQLVWFPDGSLIAVDENSFAIPLTNDYPRGDWQSVRLMIHLPNGTYDIYLADRGEPLALLASGLTYRSGFQSSLDRITVARFEAVPDALAWYDNFSAVISGVAPQPPEIIQEPPGTVLIPPWGFTINLEVVVIGEEPLFYQWYHNGEPIDNATNSTHLAQTDPENLLGIQSYQVVVTNSSGSATSIWSHVFQGLAPLMVNQPGGYRTVPVGAEVEFTTKVIGQCILGLASFPRPDVVLQWTHDDTPIPGENQWLLTITNTQPKHAGEYRVRATNLWDSVSSQPGVLKVVADFALNITRTEMDKVVISFPTMPALDYYTEWKPSLTADEEWTTIATNSGTDGPISVTNQTAGDLGLFRVRAE